MRVLIAFLVAAAAATAFQSNPAANYILGPVQTPGVQQVRGRKTLFEVISLVGGLKPEAGNSIKITRRKKYGPIPLPSNRADASGEFFVAEVKVKGIMDASSPQDNIFVQ